jgi:hypothetical protein
MHIDGHNRRLARVERERLLELGDHLRSVGDFDGAHGPFLNADIR